MRRLRRVILMFAAIMLCLSTVVGFVSIMYPWSRISIIKFLPTKMVARLPVSVLIFLTKRATLQSAKLRGLRIKWIKVGEVTAFAGDIVICLQSIDKPRGETWQSQYALVEAFRVGDGSTLWTCTVPNPVYARGESTEWRLLARDNEVWVIARNAGQINALNLQNGKPMWKYDFGFPVWEMYEGKRVVFILHGEGILCFEPKKRQILWEIRERDAKIQSEAIDRWLKVFVNPYGNEPAYTRYFSLEDGKPLKQPPKVKFPKTKEIPECVKRWLKRYKEAGIVGQKGSLFLIGAEVGAERLIAIDVKSEKVKWEVQTGISAAHCCDHNYQLAFVDNLVFYCVTSNHSHHPGEGSQLLVVELGSGEIVAKAEWIAPSEKRREEIEILTVKGKQVIVAISPTAVCKLELIAK